MNVLITGARGLLGSELSSMLKKRKWGTDTPEPQKQFALFCPSRGELDITNTGAVERLIAAEKIDLVINCAAFTDVDACESNPAHAFAVNADGTENLARSCADYGARLVQISTDYVFSGQKSGYYTEMDVCDPINVYGESKRQGEAAVLKYCSDSMIIRSSWLYGKNGNNFIRSIARLSREQDIIHVVNDQYGRPTSVRELCRFTLYLAFSPLTGIYHCTCGGEPVNWYEYALLIASVAELGVEIRPCSTEDFPRPANRPRNSCLDCSKLIRAVGRSPCGWKSEVSEFISGDNILKNKNYR